MRCLPFVNILRVVVKPPLAQQVSEHFVNLAALFRYCQGWETDSLSWLKNGMSVQCKVKSRREIWRETRH